jgi:hypothetical protein
LRKTLEQLMKDDDAAAVDLFQQHAAMLKNAYPTCYAQMEQALASYDFASALECLQSGLAA